MKKSVQLYSIRSVSEKNLEKAIRVVADIGYEGIEFAGFFDNSAEQVKGWLGECNLVATSSHVQHEAMFGDAKSVIDYHKTIGCNIIICPYYAMESVADVELLAEKFKAVTPIYREAGMTIAYHNHDFEFKKAENGRTYFEILAELTDPEVVKFELDVYWIFRGGADPVAELEKYRNRLVLFHAKDGNEQVGLELGTGSVAMADVFRKIDEIGLEWAVVESEAGSEPEEQIKSITDDYTALAKFA